MSSLTIRYYRKTVLILGLVFLILNLNCSNDTASKSEQNKIDPEKYDTMLMRFDYSQILSRLYPVWKNKKQDSFPADAYLMIAAARKARFFKEAYSFDIELGLETFKTIENFKAARINKYHYFFTALYFYLAGDRKNAIRTMDIFLGQNISEKWKNDARIFLHFFSGQKVSSKKFTHSFVKTIFNSFAANKIDYSQELQKFVAIQNRQTWMAGPLLQSSSQKNILKIADIFLNGEFSDEAIFKEKISELKVSEDSVLCLYNNYYNPLLLNNIAIFYKVLAEKFYQRIAGEYKRNNILLMQAHYEYAKLLLSFSKYSEAKTILNKLLEFDDDKILKNVYKIELYFCKIAQSGEKPTFIQKLDALKIPVLQSYYIYKMAKAGHFADEKNIKRYFRFKNMSKNERLTCSEYLGNYYLLSKDYSKSQNSYQTRLLGGAYNISRNEHIYLLKFIQSLYHNKLNRNLGNWVLRNLLKEYPELAQTMHNYALINAGNIFQ